MRTRTILILSLDKSGYQLNSSSGKHAQVILIPLKPNFYIAKLGFTGVYIFITTPFLDIMLSNHGEQIFISLKDLYIHGS